VEDASGLLTGNGVQAQQSIANTVLVIEKFSTLNADPTFYREKLM